jgi:hypothetical protein
MKKILWIVSIIFIILLTVLGYLLYKNYKTPVVQSHFEVLEVNSDTKSLRLKFVLPEKFERKEVTSKVNCPISDTVVITTHSTKPFDINDRKYEIENTAPEQRLEKINEILEEADAVNLIKRETSTEPIYNIAKTGDILRGVCTSRKCTVISKQCELYKSI